MDVPQISEWAYRSSGICSQAIKLTKKYKAFMLRIDPMILETDDEAIDNLKRLLNGDIMSDLHQKGA